jgi:Mor family transcriptional regulator
VSKSMSAEQRERFLDSLERHTCSVLEDIKLDEGTMDLVVSEIISLVSKDFAGQHIYIPTDYTHRSMSRAMSVYNGAMSVYNAVDGRNFPQVAKQFGCSERTVYRIYKRMRALIISKSQADMFNQ